MLNLIRRISGSVIPRLDRPWRDDATSNAPQIGRKRRNSSVERDDEDDERAAKRARSELPSREQSEAPPPQPETKEVREVTTGVRHIDLAPENVPLPENTPLAENMPLPAENVPLPEDAPAPRPAEVPLPEDTASDFEEAGTPPPATQVEDVPVEEKEGGEPIAVEANEALVVETNEAIAVDTNEAIEAKADETEKTAIPAAAVEPTAGLATKPTTDAHAEEQAPKATEPTTTKEPATDDPTITATLSTQTVEKASESAASQ
ncbi:hypothetical protein K525DRAFT_283436 [Schizophyllum commune Loenen D]|nr:hypothetical protein K525DRAFT_283436 [Schizophyllum commune Loenen D]